MFFGYGSSPIASGTITGSGANGQVTLWDGPSSITGNAGFTYDFNGVGGQLNINVGFGVNAEAANFSPQSDVRALESDRYTADQTSKVQQWGSAGSSYIGAWMDAKFNLAASTVMAGSVTISGPLATPIAPVVTQAGAPGAETYTYKGVFLLGDGSHTAASPAGTIATGNAVRSITDYNIVTFTAVTGWVQLDIYLTANSIGAPTGKVFTTYQGGPSNPSDLVYYDEGSETGDSTTPPTTNTTGYLTLANAGAGISIKEGTNATAGTGTLNGATEVTIATTKVTANSRIYYAIQAPHGTPSGSMYVSSRVAGTSFGVTGVALDTSDFAWWLMEPA